MLFRTHLAIGIFAVILFFPLVNYPIHFAIMAIIASLLPDIDSGFSMIGRNKPAKLVQILTKHRGILHSLTFCLAVSLIFAFFAPVYSFGFFLGYSLHLLADSFTKLGITPFWPYKGIANGVINSGGVVERGIFFVFIIVDVLLILVNLI